MSDRCFPFLSALSSAVAITPKDPCRPDALAHRPLVVSRSWWSAVCQGRKLVGTTTHFGAELMVAALDHYKNNPSVVLSASH